MGPNRKHYLEDKDQLCFGGEKIEYFSVCEEGIDEFHVGYICLLKNSSDVPTYSVRRRIAQMEIAVTSSLDEAIAALAAYYAENPPWWHRQNWQLSECRVRETKRGRLRVEEIKPRQWAAYLRGQELLIEGETAIFSTCEKAQHAADAHLHAGEDDDAEKTNGGFSWAQ